MRKLNTWLAGVPLKTVSTAPLWVAGFAGMTHEGRAATAVGCG